MLRTSAIARTRDLDKSWNIEPEPIFPLTEYVENSSVFFDEKTKTGFLFTNPVGIHSKKEEYTDTIGVYRAKDANKWNADHKAVAINGSNRIGGTGAIGMPTVIRVGNKLAMLYEATEGSSTLHMQRSINLTWMDLPLQLPQ